MSLTFLTLTQTVPGRRGVRAGATMIELLVAGTLMMVALGTWAPLIVRHGRMAVEARHYRIAVDELSNQLERLTAAPRGELASAVGALVVSDFAAERLPGAELTGSVEPVELGQRLTLSLVWDEPRRREAPLTMTAWVYSADERASTNGEDEP